MSTDIETDLDTDRDYSHRESSMGGDYIQHEREARQGHTCCGCCCDTRRAVIVINIISILFASLALISLTMLATKEDLASQFDDDEVQAFLGEMDGATIGLSAGTALLGIVCNAFGLFGAYKFHRLSIIVASIWYAVECIRACIYLDPFGLLMAGLFLYPHVVFYRELSNKIMAPESYANEKYCCECCV